MDIRDYLEDLGISFNEVKHVPFFTVEDSKKHRVDIKGIHAKSLFIKDRKSKEFFLIILPAEKRLDMKSVSEMLGKPIKFANEDDLMNYLGVKPGAVSPFGLINDVNHVIKVFIDTSVWESDVNFHPNINTATLEVSKDGFHKYIESLENEFEVYSF